MLPMVERGTRHSQLHAASLQVLGLHSGHTGTSRFTQRPVPSACRLPAGAAPQGRAHLQRQPCTAIISECMLPACKHWAQMRAHLHKWSCTEVSLSACCIPAGAGTEEWVAHRRSDGRGEHQGARSAPGSGERPPAGGAGRARRDDKGRLACHSHAT